MPELPEMETVRRDLVGLGLPGRRIACAVVRWPRTAGGPGRTALARRLRGRIGTALRRHGKELLLDQSLLAGLGNIYTDESLWRARIHPYVEGVAPGITIRRGSTRPRRRRGSGAASR